MPQRHDLLHQAAAAACPQTALREPGDVRILGIGSKETLQFTPHEKDYEQLGVGVEAVPPYPVMTGSPVSFGGDCDEVMRYVMSLSARHWEDLAALETVFMGLSAEFPLPIAVVQHRGVQSTDRLSATLRRYTTFKCTKHRTRSRFERDLSIWPRRTTIS